MNLLGKNIRRLRKERGLTLEDLAKAVGSSKGYIYQIEKQASLNPSFWKIQKIAKFFNVSLDSLCNETPLDKKAKHKACDTLAYLVAKAIEERHIDIRSEIADALLDYLDMDDVSLDLEFGTVHGIDGKFPNGDPGFYLWKLWKKSEKEMFQLIEGEIK